MLIFILYWVCESYNFCMILCELRGEIKVQVTATRNRRDGWSDEFSFVAHVSIVIKVVIVNKLLETGYKFQARYMLELSMWEIASPRW